MTKHFDAMDRFFDAHFSGFLGWVLTAAFIAVVMALDYATNSTAAMLLLAVPGLYMMGRSGGIYSLVKFVVCTMLVLVVLAKVVDRAPCDGWGEGFRMFLNVKCE